VVQRNGAAVGDQAVDELQLVRLRRDRLVARMQFLLHFLRQLGEQPVEHVVAMRRDRAERQPVAPKYFEYEYTRIVFFGASANSDTKSSAKVP
jgi:hypothetical protein